MQGSPVNCGLYVCCRSWYNGTVSNYCTDTWFNVYILLSVHLHIM